MPSGHFYVGPAMILLDKDWTGPLLESRGPMKSGFRAMGSIRKSISAGLLMRLLATMRS